MKACELQKENYFKVLQIMLEALLLFLFKLATCYFKTNQSYYKCFNYVE